MSLKFRLLAGVSSLGSAVVLSFSPIFAADLEQVQHCAVSGFNGKLEGAGGFIDQDSNDGDGGRGHGQISLTLPLGCLLGLQVDGGVGDLNGETAGGVAGHLFFRDPESYLLGAYGSWSAVGPNDIWRVGGEGEIYLGQFTFDALGGYEDSDRTKGDFFGSAYVSYYPVDNLRLKVGYEHFLDIDAAAAGIEWQPEETGLPVSLFVHGAVGDNEFATVYGGIRFYFGGPEKSLIRRHREDDPPGDALFNMMRDKALCDKIFVGEDASVTTCNPIIVKEPD